MSVPYIVIPVYKGLEETLACLETVKRYSSAYPVVLINDASPDAELCAALRRETEHTENFHLIENPVNLGFVKTANLGMLMYPERDVILLNSDTLVTSNWVEKLRRWADSDPNAATVTPFSNNATICSYPRICEANALPDGLNPDALNALFETAALERGHPHVEIPTGIGFCMYIKRRFLRQVGLFDENNFGTGYGEENDFSLRCIQAGGRHLVAVDTFIYHHSGVSFGSEVQTRRIQEAMAVLKKRYPQYPLSVQAFIEADPLEPIRRRVDWLRYRQVPKSGMLLVDHGLGGGTSKHVQDLADILQIKGWRSFILTPDDQRGVKLRSGGRNEAFSLDLDVRDWFGLLGELLKQVHICHIHIHHLSGYPQSIDALAGMLGCRYDVTLHDYFSFCPRTTGYLDENNYYCGFNSFEACQKCLKADAKWAGIDLAQWRMRFQSLLGGARKVVLPSYEAARIHQKYFPDIQLTVLAHPEPEVFLPPQRENRLGETIHVGILGGIGLEKGRRIVDDCVALSRERNLPLKWVLIGLTDQEDRRNDPDFVITGKYRPEALPELISSYNINVVVLPALWPETFSYVLSESWRLGCPVIAPDLGAFGERIKMVGAGYLLATPVTAESIIDQLMHLKDDPEDFSEKVHQCLDYRGVDSDLYYERMYSDLSPVEPGFMVDLEAVWALDRLLLIEVEDRLQKTAMSNVLTHNHATNLEAMVSNHTAELATMRQSLDHARLKADDETARCMHLERDIQGLFSEMDGLKNQIGVLNAVIRRYRLHWWINFKTFVKQRVLSH